MVSLKDLMAAEAAAAAAVTAETNNRRKLPSPLPLVVQPVQRSMSYEEVLNTKSKDASPTVSFAEIVSDQLREMDQLSKQAENKKPLHLIQIEEKAIEELMNLYGAHNNPEESIIIERLPQPQAVQSVVSPHPLSGSPPVPGTVPHKKKKVIPTQPSAWSTRTAVFK
ncbi:PREDICTED: uncharacterized protein LOC109580206 [Amphimedon queenslandica]|uniref:Uncharacterized protein n=1 Tax=Amphimedon queenslandica TaxID=400682 RepID=A0A1X7VKR0_AMPQE|nr:PREDICTED: uncharacterized protein LOC109580206 [Amphimedon queenslandica]|eukprot:XP_019848689.1 PREDICTED: uncharacterized protein LOC109580206 [Amphimedon queenslandica]